MKYTFEKFLIELFNRHQSTESAFCINNEFFSYSDLFSYIIQIMNATDTISEQYVGVYANDDIKTYASILALWYLGKTYVPLNPSQPLDRQVDSIKSIGIKHVLSSDIKVNYNDVCMIYTTNIDRYNTIIPCKKNLIHCTSESTAAYVLFTSGSTGRPKGVVITRANIAAFIDSMNNIGLNINNSDRCLQPFDLTFDFSVSSYVIPLVKGACVFTVPNRSIKHIYIAELILKYKLSVLQMVPSMIRNLIPFLDELDLSSVKYNIFCGEPLLCDELNKWHSCNMDMISYNMYGPTENTVFCTYYVIDKSNILNPQDYNNTIGIGKSFKNSNDLLLSEKGEIISEKEITGELCLSGEQLTPGYWNNIIDNQEKFFKINDKRYYKTGDLCYYSKSDCLMYVSRKDFQVKINGFRVELGEIENNYKKISNGIFCVVLPFTNEQGNTELAIIIECKEYDYSSHLSYLASKLPHYMIPKKWLFLESLPINQNGKIDRNKIKQIFKLK